MWSEQFQKSKSQRSRILEVTIMLSVWILNVHGMMAEIRVGKKTMILHE